MKNTIIKPSTQPARTNRYDHTTPSAFVVLEHEDRAAGRVRFPICDPETDAVLTFDTRRAAHAFAREWNTRCTVMPHGSALHRGLLG